MTTRVRPRDDEFQMPSFRLDGQVALVTGGSRGLGLGVALALASHGADIALAARTASTLEGAAELIRRTGRRAITVEADVSNVEQVKAMVAKTHEGSAASTSWSTAPASTSAGRPTRSPRPTTTSSWT